MNVNEQIKWLEKQTKLYLNDLESYADPFELEEQLSRHQALKEFIDFVKEVN
jgi:SPX domain protein involved in polyphosphate accumulation